jgi:hypothetical protein
MALTLYGAFGAAATTSDLYTISIVDGTPTAIGPIGFAMTGLAFDPTDGTLYGATSNNSAVHPHSLVTLDPATGAGTFIGDLTGTSGVVDLAFADDGTLYGFNTSNPRCLVSINKGTGATTSIGSAVSPSGPIEFAEGTLWKFPGSQPTSGHNVVPATGVDTFVLAIPNTGGFDTPNAMAWNGVEMYCGAQVDGALWAVPLDTGIARLIGPVPGPSGKLDAIAFSLPPPPPPPQVFTEQPWRVILTDRDQQTISLFDKRAASKQFVFTLDAPATHTGLVASDDPMIHLPYPDPDSPAVLTNNSRLLFAFRREPRTVINGPPYVCRFAGVVLTVEDVGDDAPTTRYTAYDPWQLLMSRPIRDFETGEVAGETGLVFDENARASDIAIGLLAQTELFDGDVLIDSSDSGLLEDTDPLLARLTLEQGLSVGEAWQTLCDTGTIDIWLEPIYEPVTNPGKVAVLHIYKKKAVNQYGQVMAWDSGPRSLTSISRMVDGTRLANVIRYITGFAIPGADQTDLASIAEFGQYWAQQTFPAGEDWNYVAGLAFAQLQLRKRGQKTLQVNPAPERSPLPLRDYGLGDYVPVWASRNLREPIGIDFQAYFDNPEDDPGAWGYQRIYVIPIDVDDNGVATVPELTTSVDSQRA